MRLVKVVTRRGSRLGLVCPLRVRSRCERRVCRLSGPPRRAAVIALRRRGSNAPPAAGTLSAVARAKQRYRRLLLGCRRSSDQARDRLQRVEPQSGLRARSDRQLDDGGTEQREGRVGPILPMLPFCACFARRCNGFVKSAECAAVVRRDRARSGRATTRRGQPSITHVPR